MKATCLDVGIPLRNEILEGLFLYIILRALENIIMGGQSNAYYT